MKKYKLSKQFLEEFSKVPVISVACERVGISRNTLYKWKKDDDNFRKEIEKAEKLGTESITDLAQSKLILHVQRGEPWAIKFLLRNRHKNYAYPHPKDFWEDLFEKKKITGFDVVIRHAKHEPTSSIQSRKSNPDGIKV